MATTSESELSPTAMAALRGRRFETDDDRALFTELIELAVRLDRLVALLGRFERDDPMHAGR